MENKVTVRCIAADQSMVSGCLKKATKRFVDEMEKACASFKMKFNMNPDVSLDKAPLKDSWYTAAIAFLKQVH